MQPIKFTLAYCFFGLVGLFCSPLCLAQINLKIATEYPETAMPGEGLNTFANAVKTLSNGRLLFTPSFDAKAGFKSSEMVKAIVENKIAAGDAYLPALAAVDAIFSLSALPFVATSIDDAEKLTARSRATYQDILSKAGVRWLYSTPWPATGVWSKDKLQSQTDLSKLRIRTYDSVSQAVMLPLTMTALNVSFADVMPMLTDGRVNAVLSSGDGGAGRKLWEFLPHFTEVNYAIPLSVAVINAALYESLSNDVKQIIDQAAAETEAKQWQRVRGRLEENYARMRANGVDINTSPDRLLQSALLESAKPVIADWRQKVGPERAKLLLR
jgi:TRAP-type transport system periplasmic protein